MKQPEYKKGPKVRENFERGMIALFKAPSPAVGNGAQEGRKLTTKRKRKGPDVVAPFEISSSMASSRVEPSFRRSEGSRAYTRQGLLHARFPFDALVALACSGQALGPPVKSAGLRDDAHSRDQIAL